MGSKEKKRSKKAFQGRKKKKDRSRSRKKGSKKPRRLEDSYSKSDGDSSSAYSSEEDVKRSSSRSQVRKDGKERKRKAVSSSSSSDRSFESPRAKKTKRSKRKSEGGKKKAGKKNKRAQSVSSASSDESDYEKSRGSSKKKAIGRRSGKEGKSTRGSKKYRSLSYSSSSSGSASEGERKRKRERSPSRSSLSISSESESERKRKRYWSPSSLSGRSASGDQHIQEELDFQNKPTRKLRSIIVVPEIPDQDTTSDEHEDDFAMRDEFDEWSTKSNIADRDEQIKESIDRTEVMLSVPDDEDLESILRWKALENLKRFKGGPKKAGKSDKMETSVQEMKLMRESENVADLEDFGASDMKHSVSSDEDSGLIIEDSSKVVDQVSTLEKKEVSATPSREIEKASVKHHVEIEMGGS
uniref:Uncharacterized protein n=1 Tax=Kalanchoe fedtschenkoi TaxID=63787 RepID=A0A7N0ZQG1_KALFE